MSEIESNNNETLIRYTQTSWHTGGSAQRVIIAALLVLSMLAILLSPVTWYLNMRIFHELGLIAMLCFDLTFPFVFVSTALTALKILDRKIFSKDYLMLRRLENIAVSEAAGLPFDNQFQLIDCALKANHYAVADHYSKQLLLLSMTDSLEESSPSNWMISTDCWAATGSYDSNWRNKLFTIYETRGILSLSRDLICFQSNKFSFECHPSKIVDVETKEHPRWLTITPRKYLYLTIDENGYNHSFVVAPGRILTDLAWDLNRRTEEWARHIDNVRNIHNGVNSGKHSKFV